MSLIETYNKCKPGNLDDNVRHIFRFGYCTAFAYVLYKKINAPIFYINGANSSSASY